uniref:Uncharacterized protein n=1 Tax=Arundo donax TaxID=35708 RepID=A0A0A9GBL9_ARUDO
MANLLKPVTMTTTTTVCMPSVQLKMFLHLMIVMNSPVITSKMIMIMEVISIVIVTPTNIVRSQMAVKIGSLEPMMMAVIAIRAANIMAAVQRMRSMIIKN